MIPTLVDGRLPAGEWTATWDEVEEAFGTSSWRLHLLNACCRALVALNSSMLRGVVGRVRVGSASSQDDDLVAERLLVGRGISTRRRRDSVWINVSARA